MTLIMNVISNLPLWLIAIIFIILFIILEIILVLFVRSIKNNKQNKRHNDNSKVNKMIDIAAAQDIGLREYQQDSYFVPDEVDYSKLISHGYMTILCDGMGGMECGDKASSLCAKRLSSDYYSLKGNIDYSHFFKTEIRKLDELVSNIRDDRGNYANSGTTLVCSLIKENRFYWMSVGDSRIYIIREGQINCLTNDHNYSLELKKMVENGEISLEDARNHPKKNALISYIGMNGVKICDINEQGFLLEKGDIILMCSDGLYGSLSDNAIKQTIEQYKADLDEAAYMLIAETLDAFVKNQDNVSIILMGYQL